MERTSEEISDGGSIGNIILPTPSPWQSTDDVDSMIAKKKWGGITMSDADLLTEVRFPIKASTISAGMVTLLCAIYWFATKNLAQTVIFFTACAGGTGAILSAFFAAKALDHTVFALKASRDEQQKATALGLISRWNDPAMFHVRDAVREVILLEAKEHEFSEKIAEKQTNVTHFLNFLEEIAIAIECRVADPDILKAAFKGIVVRCWILFEPFAQQIRKERKSTAIWEKVQALASKWQ